MTLYDYLEIARACLYAVGVLLYLYMCIEASNLGDRALAGVLGTLSLLYGSLLMSVATLIMGMGQIESRALITPTVFLNVIALGVMTYKRVWPLRRK